MQCVHQPLESVRTAIWVVRRVKIDPVVAPTAISGELRKRHQLDVCHTEFPQLRDALDHRVKSALVGETSYMQFIHDGRRERRRLPTGIRPVKRVMVDRSGARGRRTAATPT